MKVYILSDMEGTAGVSIWEQVMTTGPKYQQTCRWLTEEINVAADGAFCAGASLVLVNDAHLAEHNLDLDLLDPRIECLMGYGKNSWAELDGTFDVIFQIGAHAKAGTRCANLRHTWTPSTWADLRINGCSVGEIGLVAAGAGELGVPCTLVTGDDKACAEASALIPGVVTAPVKKGIGWQCARSMTPKAARDLIRERAKEACRVGKNAERLFLGLPVTVEIIELAEKKDDFYASSLDEEELFSKPLVVRRASKPKMPDAFAAAIQVKAVPLRGV